MGNIADAAGDGLAGTGRRMSGQAPRDVRAAYEAADVDHPDALREGAYAAVENGLLENLPTVTTPAPPPAWIRAKLTTLRPTGSR